MPYQKLRAADVNRDGKTDLITTNFEGGDVTVLLGNGAGEFRQPKGSPFKANPSPFSLAIADVNGDDKMDLAIANYSGHDTDASADAITVLLGIGDGRFTPASGSPFKSGRNPTNVAVGDLNGDGIADIAAGNNGGNTVTVLLGGRSGITPSPNSFEAVGRKPSSIAIGDINGDGKADIVTANLGDNDISVILTR